VRASLIEQVSSLT